MSFSQTPPTANNSNNNNSNTRRLHVGGGGGCNNAAENHNAPTTTTTTTTAAAHGQQQQQQQQQQFVGQVPVEFETSVRIRPLSKKERDDYIVLEAVPPESSSSSLSGPDETAAAAATSSSSSGSTQPQQLLAPTSVALHPIPRPDLTPSSALILQTLSPETIQTCHDVEFRFHHVFGGTAEDANINSSSSSSQDAHVYPTLGRPMAHSVMEPLMMHMNMMQGGGGGDAAAAAAVRKTTHLIIAMGGPGSGKTYTCFGGGTGGGNKETTISKRKTSLDGLVPRMMDALFGQFVRISSQQQHQKMHHHTPQQRSSKTSTTSFAVNLVILQVNQSKNPSKQSSTPSNDGSSNNNDGCKVHDLFQPVVSKAIPSALLSSSKVQSLVATLERSRSSGGNNNGTPNSINHQRTLHRSPAGSSKHLDALVRVHQDPVTQEFHVLNGQVRTCKSAERARDALQEALQNSRKRSNSKRHQSHVLVQMQPVLLDNSNKTGSRVVCEGGTIVVLDMAASIDDYNNGISNNKTRLRSGSSSQRNNKDSLVHRNDAHAAVLHCLRRIQFNEQVRRTTTSAGNNSRGGGGSTTPNNNDNSSSMSDLSSCPSSSLKSHQRAASFKQVPYRQHVLTMLLQPCFSPCKTDQTHVSIVLAASPGHRDYREKKALLTEIESSFWTAKAPPAQPVMTGCGSLLTTSTKPYQQPMTSKLPVKPSPSHSNNKNPRMHYRHQHSASDADDEFESAESKSSSTTSTASERPPKNDVFQKKNSSAAQQHQTLDSLAVQLPYSAAATRKKQQQSRPPNYPSSDADDEFESSAATKSSSSTGRPSPHHDIFKTNTIMHQHYSAPSGIDNTHSMAYSDSSIEDDDYYTLPPPIAPPANSSSTMTTPLLTRSNSSSRPPSPQRVMSPDASAPPEEHIVTNPPLVLQAKPLPVVSGGSSSNSGGRRGGGVHLPFISDFPGVSLPFGRGTFENVTSATTTSSSGGIDLHGTVNHLQQQQHTVTSSLSTTASLSYHNSNSSDSLQEPTTDHHSSSALADECGSSSSLNNNTKFSAMKNINKLVHASKKKCERVFEKMSNDLNSINISTKESINNDSETMVLKERIKELEIQNANLLRENESLRHENEQLKANGTSSFQQRSPVNPWLCHQNNSTEIMLQPSPSPEKQQHSASSDQENTSWPHDQWLQGENDRPIVSSTGKPLVASPGHGHLAHMSQGKHNMYSPESQTSLKENAAFSSRDAHQYSPKKQPIDGPLVLMPGQPLASSHDLHSLKPSDRLHFSSTDQKPTCKSGPKDAYDSKFPSSSSFLRSSSLAYPSDDENVSPPGRCGIDVPMPGDILTGNKLQQQQHRSAPTSPSSFRARREGAGSDTGSFSSNYQSALYRWKA
jgi:hypothetical protein